MSAHFFLHLILQILYLSLLALKEVTEFFKKAKAKQLDSQNLCDEDDMMCNFNLIWQAPFLPNLLNSVVFLVETSQMISVFFANYKGKFHQRLFLFSSLSFGFFLYLCFENTCEKARYNSYIILSNRNHST